MSELQQHLARLSLLGTRFTAWIGSLDIAALIELSGVAREHAFMLHKAKARAEHLMPPALEELAAEQDLTGATAWAKLYSTFTSQLTVSLELHDQAQELPISAVRGDANLGSSQ